MSELPRIPPTAPVQPTHPLRPGREIGREPRRPPPEKPRRSPRDAHDGPGHDRPGEGPGTRSDEDTDRDAPPADPSAGGAPKDGDAPAPIQHIDLRV